MRGESTFFQLVFPDPREADDEGLVAIGGDYRPESLLVAYANGIFPWPCEGLPMAWFSPNPRMVVRPQDVRISRSLRKKMNKDLFRVTYDTVFPRVIRHCSRRRFYQEYSEETTWLTDELILGMTRLHRMGFAHSVETWLDGELVGGLYGLAIGTCFCGESMFFLEPDASKVAFVDLARRLEGWGFRMIDCQVYTEHMERFGATEWPRDDFLEELAVAIREPQRRGPWTREGEGVRKSRR